MKKHLDRHLVDLDIDLGLDAEALLSLGDAALHLQASLHFQRAVEVIRLLLAAKRNALDGDLWAAPAGFAPEPDPEPDPEPPRERITISPASKANYWTVERGGGVITRRSTTGAVESLAALLGRRRGIPGSHRHAERVRRLLRQVGLEGKFWVTCCGSQMQIIVAKDIELIVELPVRKAEVGDRVPAEPQGPLPVNCASDHNRIHNSTRHRSW